MLYMNGLYDVVYVCVSVCGVRVYSDRCSVGYTVYIRVRERERE